MEKLSEDDFKQKAKELFDDLTARVTRLKDSESFIEKLKKLIEQSKALLRDGKVGESLKSYEEGLGKIEKAETSVAAESLAWNLFKIEIGYLFFLLILAYVTYRWPDFSMWRGLINLHIQTAWFGALGGVTIAIYGIYSHIQARDFDPKYHMWYISKPFIGGIFGWFVYLIYFIGLISVQGIEGTKIKTPELPFAIAFLAGFSERFTIKIIDRLMAVLTTWEETSVDAQNAKKSATGK